MIDAKYIQELLIECAGLQPQDVQVVEMPVDSTLGDYSYPVFRLSKSLRQPPSDIAKDIASKIHDASLSQVVAVGGYVNFYLDRDKFVQDALGSIDMSNKTIGKGKTICIDYSSINIAKPFHIGHLSSTVIGGSLYKMYQYLGYNVVGINHLGDWGTQFGKLVYAYLQWGDRRDVQERGIQSLLELYVKFHTLAEQDPQLDNYGREWFRKIEQGDKQATELFEWFKEITLNEVNKTYDQLGVKFDSYAGESFFNDKIPPVVQELRDKGLLQESKGAMVVELSPSESPVLILRSDGASLYITRDLAAAIYRKQTYDFDKCIYVVAYQQNLHFKQLFGTLYKMGYEWASDCVHVAFGMVSLKDGTLSTRKGQVVFLDKVLQDAVSKAYKTIESKNPNLPSKHRVAEMVGVGAVVFGALSSGRIKDVVFDIDKALEFEGETGPYLQYTYARCCSILRKSTSKSVESLQSTAIQHDNVDLDTFELVKLLSRFDETVVLAVDKFEPSILARLMLDIAQAFNKFYISNHILGAEQEVARARLQVVQSTSVIISKGLELLLLQAPEEM
ncbi:MAG: arginine--tRNA ligase [Clostridiales bacterium]|jgi:arginyl-tRNA synthetase|nr:arginine--tRNA ligase [Clostridiales bacterium]